MGNQEKGFARKQNPSPWRARGEKANLSGAQSEWVFSANIL